MVTYTIHISRIEDGEPRLEIAHRVSVANDIDAENVVIVETAGMVRSLSYRSDRLKGKIAPVLVRVDG